MEKNFYSVEVGRAAHQRAFVTEVAFVVSAAEKSDVFKHYQKQYQGFDINVREIVDIRECNIPDGGG